LGDLIVAAVVVAAVARGVGDRVTMHLVLAGIIAFAVADTWFAVVVTAGDFGRPYWLDTGWVLGYFLIALGALRGSHNVGRRTTSTPAAARLATAPSGGGRYWLASANTDHIVNYAAMLLIVVDASVVLYDLGSILKMLG
jgi:hypothetical protein